VSLAPNLLWALSTFPRGVSDLVPLYLLKRLAKLGLVSVTVTRMGQTGRALAWEARLTETGIPLAAKANIARREEEARRAS
jgi:hypothetical protein